LGVLHSSAHLAGRNRQRIYFSTTGIQFFKQNSNLKTNTSSPSSLD